MKGTMTKAALLGAIRGARAEWDATLAEVGEGRMTEPGLAGGWSVKDVIAHITWSEREMVGMLGMHALVDAEGLWAMDQDARNAAVYESNRARPLAEVLAKARDTYAELLDAVAALDEEDVNDPHRYKDMPVDWRPWDLVAGGSYRHYRDHIEPIRAWLARHD